jgi:glycosyltransferase 2 family protein
MKPLLKKALCLIGIALFIYIISSIDLGKLLSLLADSEPKFLALGAVVAPLVVLVMVLRWRLILKATGIEYGFAQTFVSLAKGSLLGELTPGKLGDLIRAKFVVNETGSNIGRSLFTVVIDRIYDLVVLLVLATVSGIALVWRYVPGVPLYAIAVLCGGFFLFVLIFRKEGIVKATLSPLFNLLIPAQYQETAHLHFREFYGGLKSVKRGTHGACVVLSFAVWQLKFLGLYLLALAIGMESQYWFLICIGPLVVIIGLLPISISGFGTRDAAFIFFLSLKDVPAEFAVALALLYVAFGFWGIGVSGAVATVWRGRG